MKPLNTAEKFWAMVEPIPFAGCWLWMGGYSSQGYGVYALHGKQYLAHRLAHQLTTGIPPDGLCVCHRCDVRECINPQHLFLGTIADNINDMWAKGRGAPTGARGERAARSKLTSADVLAVREKLANGVSLVDIAREFGVTRRNIAHIKLGKTWAHLI